MIAYENPVLRNLNTWQEELYPLVSYKCKFRENGIILDFKVEKFDSETTPLMLFCLFLVNFSKNFVK